MTAAVDVTPEPVGPTNNILLVVGRMVDQGALGIATILLARWLPVAEFATASVLLIVNSLAIMLADFGLGYQLLALPSADRLSVGSLHRLRTGNGLLALLTVATGALVGGEAGWLVAGSGVLWMLAGEAYVRGAGAIRAGRVGSILTGQVVGATVFLFGISAIRPGNGVAVLAGSLAAKQLAEGLAARGWTSSFDRQAPVRRGLVAIFLSLVSAVALANVDFAVAAALLGSADYVVYLVAFRIAQVPVTLIANVVSRTAMVDYARASSLAARQSAFDDHVRRLFATGCAAAVCIAAVGPLVAGFLGSGYDELTATLLLLVVGVPWRMVIGQAGSLFVVAGAASRLVRAFPARLAIMIGALSLGGWLGGLPGLAAGGVASIVITSIWLLRLAAATSGLRPPVRLNHAGLATSLVLLVLIGLQSP